MPITDEHARALIFVREVGAIDNAAYRNLNKVDTLTASISLRRLRDLGLLAAKNQGVATYYVQGEKLITSLGKRHMFEGKRHQFEGKEHQFEGKEHQFEGGTSGLKVGEISQLNLEIPEKVQEILSKLGKKASEEQLCEAIITLCEWRDLTAMEVALYLKRERKRLVRKFLTPMVNKGLLAYKFPQMLGHPKQAYRRDRKNK